MELVHVGDRRLEMIGGMLQPDPALLQVVGKTAEEGRIAVTPPTPTLIPPAR
jgi:hypothetical protein